jgi:hypothetical protein
MGSDSQYPEERPVRRVAVDGFWIDPPPDSTIKGRERHPVVHVADTSTCHLGFRCIVREKSAGEVNAGS